MAKRTERPALRVREMRVIWRDTFIVESATPKSGKRIDFLETSRDRLTRLPSYVCDRFTRRHDQTDLLRIIERASRNVARIGYDSLVRYQFQPFQMTDLRPTLSRLRCGPEALKPEDITDAALEARKLNAWIEITPMLVLHRAGVGIMEYLASITHGDGYLVDEAIEMVRLGISTQLLALPETWARQLPQNIEDWAVHSMVSVAPDWNLVAAGLRDISQIVAGYLEQEPDGHQERAINELEELPNRPTGSATVVIVATEPMAGGEIAQFVKDNASALRGIGAMDTYFRERAGWIVERELGDNLSVDNEAAVYLLGNSELVLFNDQLPPIAAATRQRLGVPDERLVVTYLYYHYQVLMEWSYFQDAILRAYINRLDILATTEKPARAQMIATMQGALKDLVQYQENITPYATRIEFLEKVRDYHKLDELSERFEHKQELLLNYFSEYHGYREARAAEFLNLLAAIIAGTSLAAFVTTLLGVQPGANPTQTAIYVGVNLVAVAIVLIVLWVRQRYV